MTSRAIKIIETTTLIAVPVALFACAYFQWEASALLMLAVVLAGLIIFFISYEKSKPSLRQILPAGVLAALAAAGRILFVYPGGFQPVSAICIVAGVVFGKRTGFMVGALAAFVSNFFLGQGPWTPWQMYAWGMIGYVAGIIADHGFFKKPIALYAYGFFASLCYGFLLNTWYLVGFINPITWQSALTVYGAGFVFDAVHALSTIMFLLIIYQPWRKKLERIKTKYDFK